MVFIKSAPDFNARFSKVISSFRIMSLKTIVKVSHVSNLSDARYCAGMGVDMLGVGVISSHQDYMAPPLFQEIRGWIAGPKIVAELYGVSTHEEIRAAVETYAPDYFELTLDEYLKFGSALSLPCLVYCGETMPAASVVDPQKVSHFIAGERLSCKDLPERMPVMIQVTTVPSLQEKLAQGCFRGIVLEGPRQSRVGMTSYEELGDLLEALEDD